jgi:hypothetical protein
MTTMCNLLIFLASAIVIWQGTLVKDGLLFRVVLDKDSEVIAEVQRFDSLGAAKWDRDVLDDSAVYKQALKDLFQKK